MVLDGKNGFTLAECSATGSPARGCLSLLDGMGLDLRLRNHSFRS